MDRTRSMGIAMGVIRLGVGGAMVVAPRWAGQIWVGPGADGPGSTVFARALGARDVALGGATLAALRSRRDTSGLLQLGFLAGTADAVGTLVAAKHLDGRRGIVMPLIAMSVGTVGLLAARVARQADEESETEVLPDEVRAKVATDDVDLRAVDQTRV